MSVSFAMVEEIWRTGICVGTGPFQEAAIWKTTPKLQPAESACAAQGGILSLSLLLTQPELLAAPQRLQVRQLWERAHGVMPDLRSLPRT